MSRIVRDWPTSHLLEYAPPIAQQTGFLFLVDAVTNLTDYGFHVFLGRALVPGDFAIVQTINAAVLIVLTTFAVMQPVVARYVAENRVVDPPARQSRVIFQTYFQHSAFLGLALTAGAWLGRRMLARWMNVPALAVGLMAPMLLLALLRSVVSGMLQGQQRFVAYGVTRSTYALGRLGMGVLLVSLGAGALGAVTAQPIGAALALLLGLSILGASVWRSGPGLPANVFRDGLGLTAKALVAYTAYMGLQTVDLIWVNRSFPAEVAGGYATAVLLRRALALLPGAVVVTLYPRVVARVTRGESPDKLLWQTAGIVVGPTLVLTAVYFAFGPTIVRLTFGAGYEVAGPLLGWLGLAMLGYGLGSIWLNVYLGTRPLPFVILLILAALLEGVLLALRHETLTQVIAVFGLTGWMLAIGGLLLYVLWLRPRLASRTEA